MIRNAILRCLYSLPHFAGRDRLIARIVESFAAPVYRLEDGLLMELDGHEWTQHEILMKGSTEPGTLKLITELVGDGDVVIDVGAHIGHHALVAARRVGQAGRVLAIDAQPSCVDHVARNAFLNGFSQIEAICAAAGDDSGFIRIRLQRSSDRARLSLALTCPNDCDVLIEVPMRRLRDILSVRGIGRVQLLKIDVEGFEFEVISGLGGRLRDCRNIIFEILGAASAEATDRLIRHLEDAQFSLRTIDGRDWKVGDPLPENNVWARRD